MPRKGRTKKGRFTKGSHAAKIAGRKGGRKAARKRRRQMSEYLTPPFVIQLFTTVAAIGALYGGIRSDMKHMRKEIDRQGRAISKVHARVDEILLKQ